MTSQVSLRLTAVGAVRALFGLHVCQRSRCSVFSPRPDVMRTDADALVLICTVQS